MTVTRHLASSTIPPPPPLNALSLWILSWRTTLVSTPPLAIRDGACTPPPSPLLPLSLSRKLPSISGPHGIHLVAKQPVFDPPPLYTSLDLRGGRHQWCFCLALEYVVQYMGPPPTHTHPPLPILDFDEAPAFLCISAFIYMHVPLVVTAPHLDLLVD